MDIETICNLLLLACVGVVAIPGILIVVGILIYSSYKYGGGHKNNIGPDNFPYGR